MYEMPEAVGCLTAMGNRFVVGERPGKLLIGLTFEGFLFYASIVGAIVGFVAYRVYLARRRVEMWEQGHAPGHESFLELPYPRDLAFLAAREVLPRYYTLAEIGDRERIVLGTKKVWILRTDRVSVKVDPTLQGCEVIFARLGPLWWRQKKGVPGPEGQAFFDDLVATLEQWKAARGHMAGGHYASASGTAASSEQDMAYPPAGSPAQGFPAGMHSSDRPHPEAAAPPLAASGDATGYGYPAQTS